MHVAEVLQQAETSQVMKDGWIGGDAWFGSVNSCVELMKLKGVHSTFIQEESELLSDTSFVLNLFLLNL